MSPFRRLLSQIIIGFWIYTLLHMAAILTMLAGYKVQKAVIIALKPLWGL